jgi:hypothetical protein
VRLSWKQATSRTEQPNRKAQTSGLPPPALRGRLSGGVRERGRTGAHPRCADFRLPGGGDQEPTLEIFTYSQLEESLPTVASRPGFGHIAFEVEDVAAAQQEVLSAGGGAVGEIVTLATATGARVTWCYVTDPEGDMIELETWATAKARAPDLRPRNVRSRSPMP